MAASFSLISHVAILMSHGDSICHAADSFIWVQGCSFICFLLLWCSLVNVSLQVLLLTTTPSIVVVRSDTLTHIILDISKVHDVVLQESCRQECPCKTG